MQHYCIGCDGKGTLHTSTLLECLVRFTYYFEIHWDMNISIYTYILWYIWGSMMPLDAGMPEALETKMMVLVPRRELVRGHSWN